MKIPVIELSDCILCDVCVEVCPAAFHRNPAGFIEVISLDDYSESAVGEGIKNCPTNCIFWDER